MIPELSFLTHHWQAAIATFTGMTAILANTQVPPNGWEDYGLKGILLVAVGFLVRYLLRQQEQHRSDVQELHKQQREGLTACVDKCSTAMSDNSKALQDLKAATQEQTEYFRSVGKKIIESSLGKD